ncbi:hypothetical protein SPRG_16447 [Saprolegnia parasitica CBS 223.65]|uniref:Uncharacterized protein n=1 Tax=Saprolegnia parasitica (strain CBS 223.65) TaxID=695850 RepID=A0A067BN32_SAPPC|nr:hypothetical protein SPRG_16447 [Saprolegnia parasitica CBS 223.65]KDO18150.1 hypothetical protein SPRG_16447 [Saprolegnia parasitica CBS 223.65]|eukprot:XP_012211141.1 hypothetical protein SPRG_16447 [Saprolegnia parasitica CBS 223.65]
MAAACTSDQQWMTSALWNTNVSAACAATFDTAAKTMMNAIDIQNRYQICQAPCSADLVSLMTNLPVCDDNASILPIIAQIGQSCATTNGAWCTSVDDALFNIALSTPAWANCTSALGATLLSLAPEDIASAYTLCGSATCRAFIASVADTLPNCWMTSGTNTRTLFQQVFGCTPATMGGPCTMIDQYGAQSTMQASTVWSNCSNVLGWPTSFQIVARHLASPPSGFCQSPCPRYLLSVLRALPHCTVEGGQFIDDLMPVYSTCPDVLTTVAPTLPSSQNGSIMPPITSSSMAHRIL